MSNKTTIGISLPLSWMLFGLFTILKITGNIDWSWWIVTSPLWLPLVFFIILLAIMAVIAIILGVSNR